MYAAHVTHIQVEPDQVEAFLHTVRTAILPQGKPPQGYKGVLVLCNPETGKLIGMSVWETEADCQAFEESGLAESHRRKTGPLNPEPFITEFYQVRIAQGSFEEPVPQTT